MTHTPTHSPPTDVHLRAVVQSDLAAIYQQQSDADSNRMAFTKPRDAESFDAIWKKIFADTGVVARVIVADGAMVGTISRFKMGELDAVGYWIAKEHWGRGIATRALALLLREDDVRPLHARVAKSNVASIRVLERNGFVNTGYHQSAETERLVACEEAMLLLE